MGADRGSSSTKTRRRSILMLPWLAHGHISPFFELAKRLTSLYSDLQIYFCSTPVNLHHLRNETLLPPSIQLVELHIPSSFHGKLPPNSHTTKNLPPHLMPTLKSAFDESEPEFSQILTTLRPDFLIYDFITPWAPKAAARELGIKSVVFITGGAACHSFFAHYIITPPTGQTQFPFPNLDIVSSGEGAKKVEFLHSNHQGSTLTDKDRYFQCVNSSSDIILIKTFKEIEGKYVDYLSKLLGKEVVTVGGLVREPEEKTGDADVITWLNQRACSSPVVFVSFGSEYFLTKEEMMQVAKGLERNKDLNFIWVVRFPDQGNGEQGRKSLSFSLPEGFLERVAGRGLVVEGWSPQAKILQHERVRGFVSHCGWSSVLEGLVYGVPIVAMPMQLDQPWDAKLVEEIGVGKEVRRSKDGMVDGEEMGRVIDEVLGDEGMKERVRELSEKLKGQGDDEMVAAAERLWSLIESV